MLLALIVYIDYIYCDTNMCPITDSLVSVCTVAQVSS